jgi:hypothetical protein
LTHPAHADASSKGQAWSPTTHASCPGGISDKALPPGSGLSRRAVATIDADASMPNASN